MLCPLLQLDSARESEFGRTSETKEMRCQNPRHFRNFAQTLCFMCQKRPCPGKRRSQQMGVHRKTVVLKYFTFVLTFFARTCNVLLQIWPFL